MADIIKDSSRAALDHPQEPPGEEEPLVLPLNLELEAWALYP